MRKGSTVLFAALAVATGAVSIVIGTEVRDLTNRLAGIHRAIAAEQEALHVLRAEWSYLNRPQRLETLARRHLDLRAPKPEQTVRVSDLPFAAQPGFAGPDADRPPSSPSLVKVSAGSGTDWR